MSREAVDGLEDGLISRTERKSVRRRPEKRRKRKRDRDEDADVERREKEQKGEDKGRGGEGRVEHTPYTTPPPVPPEAAIMAATKARGELLAVPALKTLLTLTAARRGATTPSSIFRPRMIDYFCKFVGQRQLRDGIHYFS